MYNLQFEEAHRSFARWQTLRPEDALGPASDAAAYLFSKFDRLHILQSEFFTQDDHFIIDRRLAPDPGLKLPVLMWPAPVATVRSAMKVSSVSPDLWETKHR